MRNQAQVLLKRSCWLGKLVNTHIKEFTLVCTGKNNISISCIFNGFKYTYCKFGNVREGFIFTCEVSICEVS